MGPHTENYAVGQVPGAARRAVARAADGARRDRRRHHARAARDRHPHRAAAAGRVARQAGRDARPGLRWPRSTSVSVPGGSARSTTPRASTFEQRGQLLTDTLAACKALWRDTPADFERRRSRSATSIASRSRCNRAACRCGSRARCTPATSTGSCATATRGSRSWARPSRGSPTACDAVRDAWTAAGTRSGRVAGAGAAAHRRGDDGRPDIARSMESVPELLPPGATDVQVTVAGIRTRTGRRTER